MRRDSISIVTPTLRRPEEVKDLLGNLSLQTVLPTEVVLVDGAPQGENATDKVIDQIENDFPFEIKYIRHEGGTAIQRNIGVDNAAGDFIAFVDDDVRLEPAFLEKILAVFHSDRERRVGGVVGYRTNEHFTIEESQRWRWYKRLRLLTLYEPGRYDFATGYPINNNLQPPFTGTRPVDFMTTACAVWRREVFSTGLRFDPFFRDFGVLEDAHFSLRAGRQWMLLQSGDARCEEMHSPNGRVDRRRVGYKSVVNYYFVFQNIAGPLRLSQKYRFWRYQMFEAFRVAASAVRRGNAGDMSDLIGRLQGASRVIFQDYKDI